MMLRYLARALVTSLVLWALPLAVTPTPGPRCFSRAETLYSARALRRLRTELQLRLLEARKERARLADAVIARRTSVDALLSAPDDAALLRQGALDAYLKHFMPDPATTCW